MASLDDAAFAAGLKTLYPGEAIKNLAYARNPLLGMMPKDETFLGDSSKEPLTIGNPQNRSVQFGVANNVVTTSVIRAFLITRVKNYSMAAIDNETMMASESDKGAFLKAAKYEVDNALNALTRSIAVGMYRAGTGTVANIAATATINSSSVPVQLALPASVTNLEYGMSLGFSATDGGAARAGLAYVVQIDRDAGTFLCSGSPGGSPAALTSLVTGVAVSDYIYQSYGDVNGTISGLQAWLTGPTVSSSSFFGVNRAIDKSRLAGQYFDGSAETIEEALIDGANLVAREGGAPDYAFMNFQDYSNLIKALGSKQQSIQYTDVKVDEPGVSVGYSAVQIIGPNGPIKVIPDQNCPVGVAFLLQMDTWKLKSLGEVVRLFHGDTLDLIRNPNADELLVRCFSYANMSCRAPGFNCVVRLPS